MSTFHTESSDGTFYTVMGTRVAAPNADLLGGWWSAQSGPGEEGGVPARILARVALEVEGILRVS